MSIESLMIRNLRDSLNEIGFEADLMYRRTKKLLQIYRVVKWNVGERKSELDERTYLKCMGDCEMLTYLMNFAPKQEFKVFQGQNDSILMTRVLLELICRSVRKLRFYPKFGKVYYSIIDLAYISQNEYSEDELLEKLDMERSTYYRKKKEAEYLLGYIIFSSVNKDMCLI